MALYVTLSLCALLAGLLVYRYDLYEREPLPMLLLAVAAGGVGMRLVGAVELWSLDFVGSIWAIAALAALHEEMARFVLVFGIAALFPRQFNDPMDGLVYGSMVGLGMALEESFYLLGLLKAPGPITLPLELVRLAGHLVMGGIVGFGLGLARVSIPGWKPKLVQCFLIATAIHFVWDWIALTAPDSAPLSTFQTVASVAVMLFGMLFYGALVHEGSVLSKRRFAPESSLELWGWPFTALKRRREP